MGGPGLIITAYKLAQGFLDGLKQVKQNRLPIFEVFLPAPQPAMDTDFQASNLGNFSRSWWEVSGGRIPMTPWFVEVRL